MKNWKASKKLVWHTTICPKCRKVAQRIKLPGITQQVFNRLCNNCSVEVAMGENKGEGNKKKAAPSKKA